MRSARPPRTFLCVQEALDEQVNDLAKTLDGYRPHRRGSR